MNVLAPASLAQCSYDANVGAFHDYDGSTGPRVTPPPQCWPGTSDQVVVVHLERPRSAEDLVASREVDLTGAEFRSAHIPPELVHDRTNAQGGDDLAPVLEEIIAEGMPRLFVALVEAVDWSTRRPDELTAAIDLALQQGMSNLTLRLAHLGGRLFPNHERIQRAAQVFAPATAQPARLPPAKGLEASRKWVREHADEYRGQWVAVGDGQLVGVAPRLEELEAVGGAGTANLLVTKVL